MGNILKKFWKFFETYKIGYLALFPLGTPENRPKWDFWGPITAQVPTQKNFFRVRWMGINMGWLYSKFQNSNLKGVVCPQETIKSHHFWYLAHRDISGNRMLRNLKIPPFTRFTRPAGLMLRSGTNKGRGECGRASGETEESLDPMSPMLYFALNSQKSPKSVKIRRKFFLVKVEARPHFST